MFSKKRVIWGAGALLLVLLMFGLRQSARLEASLLIDAPAEKVWAVLVDFKNYSAWNPYIVEAELSESADLRRGIGLKIQMQPAGIDVAASDTNQAPRSAHETEIFLVRPARELRWGSSLWLPFIFDSEHWYQLERVGSRTLLRNGEKYRGVFVFLVNRQATRLGFTAMNAALKKRVESQP
jgi:hypothetical protein